MDQFRLLIIMLNDYKVKHFWEKTLFKIKLHTEQVLFIKKSFSETVTV